MIVITKIFYKTILKIRFFNIINGFYLKLNKLIKANINIIAFI